MARLLTCPQGHAWQPTDGGADVTPCPVCGGAGSPSSDERDYDPRKTQPLEAPGAGPTDIPDVPGYEIIAEVGRGGMGVVYRARQKGLNRIVALKMILGGAHAGPVTLARFRAEAEAVARLQHPHIVQIYEVNEYHGRPYFSLEYIEGGSLAERLNGTPQAPDAAARLVRTLAEAIHVAHQRGIVHRDLKPGNILLAACGSAPNAKPQAATLMPKITDFCLAKRLDLPAANTQSGSLLGTPQYMAPEQASGHTHAVGPPADIYALGAMLYEMLTGRPPFVAATPLDTLMQVVQQEPVPPRRLNPRVPRDLDTICLKCLQKEPHKRYESAEALADDLGRFLDGQPIKARPVGGGERFARWCRRNPVVAGLTVAVAVLLLAASAISTLAAVRIAGARDQAEQSADDARTAQRQAEGAAAGEREARAAAEAQRRLAAERLALMHVASGGRALDAGDLFGALPWFAAALHEAEGDPAQEALHRTRLGTVLRQLPRVTQVWFPEGGAQSVAVSPDGKVVLVVGRTEARVYDIETGAAVIPPLRPGEGSSLGCGAFSADGRHIALGGPRRPAQGHVAGEARVWDARTGAPVTPPLPTEDEVTEMAFDGRGARLVTVGNHASHGWFELRSEVCVWDTTTGKPLHEQEPDAEVLRTVLSPDGSRWLKLAKKRQRPGGDFEARLGDAGTGEAATLVLKTAAPIEYAAFSPDGRLIITIDSGSTRLWDAHNGQALPVVPGQGDPTLFATFGPDGRQMLTSGDRTTRLWDATTGKPIGSPLAHEGNVTGARFSPAGHRLLTTSGSASLGAARVWDAATGHPVTPPLPHEGACPATFTPDGRRVVTGGPHGSVWLWDTAVMAHAAPPLRHLIGVRQVAFSPDSRRALTVSYRDARVWDVATGAAITPLLSMPDSIGRAMFSPDGSRVLTGSSGPRGPGQEWQAEVRVWDAATGKALTPSLTHPGMNVAAAFSPDGRLLATAGGFPNGEARVWEAATGQPVTPLLQLAHRVVRVAFSPDGKQLLTAGEGGTGVGVSLHDVATGRALWPTLAYRGVFLEAMFAPGGHDVLVADHEGVRVWKPAEGRSDLLPFRTRPSEMKFSGDASRLVTALDTQVRVWDPAAGKEVAPALQAGSQVHLWAVSRDGSRLVTSTGSGVASRWEWRLWDGIAGEPLTPPAGDHRVLMKVFFSPDGRRFVTVVSDASAPSGPGPCEARVWDATTGQALTPALPHQKLVSQAVFSPDSRRLLTASDDGGWLWDVSPDERPRDDLVELAHFLSRQRVHAGGGCLPVEWDRADFERRWQALRKAYPPDFTAAPADVLAWHDREADRCERAHQWEVLAQHLAPLLEAEPKSPRLHKRRATARAEQGQWREAAADFERYAALDESAAAWALENAAAALLGAGDTEGYRQMCNRLLSRVGEPEARSGAQDLLGVCTLAPGAVTDPQSLLRLADRVYKDDPDDPRSGHALGTSLYRAGKHPEALERLKVAARDGSVGSMLWLALAYARTGKPNEARQWLRKAAEAEKKEVRWVYWGQRLEERLLREEAETEIKRAP